MSVLTDRDVAAELGVSWQQVQERCKAKQWPHFKVGRYYRFTPEHVAQIIELSTVAPAAPVENPWGVKSRRSKSA